MGCPASRCLAGVPEAGAGPLRGLHCPAPGETANRAQPLFLEQKEEAAESTPPCFSFSIGWDLQTSFLIWGRESR